MSEFPKLTAYILAKNEEPNIAKCLRSLEACGIPVVVLDSGSTDRTKEIATEFSFCEVRDFAFTSHTDAWNLITSEWHSANAFALILDADMEIPAALWGEIVAAVRNRPQVVISPVSMYLEGRPLKHGSLYPPKPIVFQGGAAYFVASGHCSRLKDGLSVIKTRAMLIHNDLKPYSAYLLSQVRYGQLLYQRYKKAHVSLKDRLRANSPIMAFVYPFVSLVVYGGLLCGRRGVIYALDRAIAVLVQWRVVLAERLRQGRPEHKSE